MNLLMRISFAALALSVCLPLHAQENDADGCKDHPLFNRLPNHYISTCQSLDFDSQDFPLGSLDENMQPKDVMTVEGSKTIIDYNLQQDGSKANSGLQAMRNFQNAVKAAGGTVVAEFGAAGSPKNLCDAVWGCADHATTLKLNKNGKEIWVLVLPQGDNDGRYTLRISEREAMKQDIAANELLDKINKDGFIALYLNFDTGKATLKADSVTQLDQIAQMLKAAPDLKLEVAGHTDNAGAAASNKTLSEQRAQTVMKALTGRGIAAARLTAKGYGQDKPIADNKVEEGRAKNRRVELVKR
jgi:OOP family OmpA-OmpF porin